MIKPRCPCEYGHVRVWLTLAFWFCRLELGCRPSDSSWLALPVLWPPEFSLSTLTLPVCPLLSCWIPLVGDDVPTATHSSSPLRFPNTSWCRWRGPQGGGAGGQCGPWLWRPFCTLTAAEGTTASFQGGDRVFSSPTRWRQAPAAWELGLLGLPGGRSGNTQTRFVILRADATLSVYHLC